MLLKRQRCLATGVVNFFVADEPHLAVATVVKPAGLNGYIWRYHGDRYVACGTGADLRSVEKAVNEHHRLATQVQDREDRDHGRFAA